MTNVENTNLKTPLLRTPSMCAPLIDTRTETHSDAESFSTAGLPCTAHTI